MAALDPLAIATNGFITGTVLLDNQGGALGGCPEAPTSENLEPETVSTLDLKPTLIGEGDC